MARQAADGRVVSVCAANIAQQLRANLLDDQPQRRARSVGRRGPAADNVGPVDLQQIRTVESSGVTHLRYRVLR